MLTDVLSMLAPQNRRLFKLNILTQTANDEFLLEHFSGTEELSKLYEFDLALLSQQSDVKLKSLIGSQATIEIELSNGSSATLTAMFSGLAPKAATAAMCVMQPC